MRDFLRYPQIRDHVLQSEFQTDYRRRWRLDREDFNNDLNYLDRLLDVGWEIPPAWLEDKYRLRIVTRAAARRSDFELLGQLEARINPEDIYTDVAIGAALGNQVELLQEVLTRIEPERLRNLWSSLAYHAALGGHLDLLPWLDEAAEEAEDWALQEPLG
jgi:hypothetical protein